MDFYVDIAVAVLLRLIRDRRSAMKYLEALAKVHRELDRLSETSPNYAAVRERDKRVGP